MNDRRALIIDDEPDVATYLATVLADNGWNAEIANGAEEGLALARQSPPDLVLLDVMMPERGGMSTLVAFRKEEALASTRVILVTGIQESLNRDFEEYLHRFKSYRADAYLEKPVDPERLMEAVDEVMAAPAS